MRKIFNLSLSLSLFLSFLLSVCCVPSILSPFLFFSSRLPSPSLSFSRRDSQSRFSLLSTQKNTCTSPLHVVNARTQSLTRLDSSHERESRNPLFEPRLTSLRENTFLLYSLRDISGKRKEEKKRCLFTLSLSLSLIFFFKMRVLFSDFYILSLSTRARFEKWGVNFSKKKRERENLKKFPALLTCTFLLFY